MRQQRRSPKTRDKGDERLRRSNRRDKEDRREWSRAGDQGGEHDRPHPTRKAPPLEPRTEAQQDYIHSVCENQLTFAIGPAGTGKTYIAAALAVEAFQNGEVDRIIITRPAVEAGRGMGFLPGEASEKFAPYFAPFRIELEKRLGKGAVEMFLKNERIIAMPLEYMRGHTFDGAFVILDEAQNTTPVEMKLFLTRLGEDTRVIVDGDPRQKDIPGDSGLDDALMRLQGLASVNTIRFTRADIVRSGLVQDIVERYES